MSEIKVYGNKHILNTFENMNRNNRMAHSFLIYGEKGLGKKTIADYLAALLVCESENKPCFQCRSCNNALEKCHPDIIYAEHSGKLGGFSVDTIRNICTDAYIKPNNGETKVYVLTDADNITVQAQNSLLKLIEEPPAYAYFIFTASSKNIFLETVLSRIISLSVSEVSKEEATEALLSKGISGEDAEKSYGVFNGNIGMCLEYLNSDTLKQAVKYTTDTVQAILSGKEYDMLLSLTSASSDKAMFKTVVSMLDKAIRDALVIKFREDSAIGCCRELSKKISMNMTMASCRKMHEACNEAYALVDRNVNIKLIASNLCAHLMNAK